jgi:V/A-type H+-transporting ATPase subunit C
MKSLAKYAYLNALIRARLSRCLGEREFRTLAQTADLAEAAPLLKETDYGRLAPLIESGAPPALIEKALLEIEIQQYRDILRHAEGAVGRLVFALMEVHDVGKVEGLLRLWSEKEWDARESLVEEEICYPMPVDSILKAASIEEIILLLDRTPFKDALAAAYGDYRRSNRLFYLEAALEADYYRRLWQRVDELGKHDRSVAGRLIGLEVDIRNLEILIRMKTYCALPAGELRRVLLPGGLSLSEQALTDAYASGDLRAVGSALRSIPLKSFPPPAGPRQAIEQLRLLQALLGEAVAAAARRVLVGYPFTIGTVVAYFSLRRAEAGELRRLLVGKAMGIEMHV